MINKKIISEALGIEVENEFNFSTLGMSNSEKDNTLTFLDDEKYLEQIILNEKIKGLFITSLYEKEIKVSRNDLTLFIVDDPRYYFYQLFNIVAKTNVKISPSQISGSAVIHSTAYVSENNTQIGANVIIGPNVSILENVKIGANTIIQAGTVIGSVGYEYKRTNKGIISVYHDGNVIIGENVEIGANTCIDKGFSFRQTIIEDDVKIDNLVHIAHGVQIGKGSFIIASAMLGGSLTIGENVWVGPNASVAPSITLGDNSFVTFGSVVTKNVNPNEKVTGNFAIPHITFLRNLKRIMTE